MTRHGLREPACIAGAWRLLELSERFGHDTQEGISLELPLSQEQLVGWCGASRESTVKALASLRALGCITTGRVVS